MTKIHLSDRALNQFKDIFEFSQTRWGSARAKQYIRGFEDAFQLLRDNPKILKHNKNISSRFYAYHAQKHVLICDVIDQDVFVLDISHVSMNLMDHLQKIVPTLDAEAKALHKLIKSKRAGQLH